MNGFRDIEGVVYTPLDDENAELRSIKESNLVEDYISWKELRSKLPYGELTMAMNLSHLNQWRSEREERLGTLTSDDWKVLRANEYHYKKHLVVTIYNSSFSDFMEALLNLQAVCLLKSEPIKALGLLQFYERLQDSNSDFIWDEGEKYVENAKKEVSKYISPENTENLSYISNIENIFHYIWCLDDLENGTLMKE